MEATPGRFMVGVLIADRDPDKEGLDDTDFRWMKAPSVRSHTWLPHTTSTNICMLRATQGVHWLSIFCERLLNRHRKSL